MKRTAALLGAAALLASCAGRAPLPEGERPPRPAAASAARAPTLAQLPDQPLLAGDRDQIVMTAFAQVGKPYLYGGNGPAAFDCSGLVRYAYAAGGAKTPRTSATLFAAGQAIRLSDAKPGDLLFYRLDASRSTPSHVVFYLGEGEGIHAPSTGGAIRIVRTGIPYFTQRFAGARRLIE